MSSCASYVVTVSAQTEAGFNDTLTLKEIVIPSRDEGLLKHSHFINQTKVLGVIIQHNLKWNSHIHFIQSKIAKTIRVMNKVKKVS